MNGLIGRKVGMTRMFDGESGRVIPVTVIQAGTNVVHQVKTVERDGYSAVQLGFGAIALERLPKPQAGQCKKLGTEAARVIKEFALDSETEGVAPGQKVGVEVLENVKYVDVTGVSKGRGFTGTVKRYNFTLGPASHGNTNYRERGSVGSNTYPARVFPGLKMAGHYGASTVTAKRLEVVGLDNELGLVYVKGAVPGRRSGIVFVRKCMRK